MIEEPEHPYRGAESGRSYVDPSTATNARQAGEYIASNEAFRQRQDTQRKIDRRTVMLLEKLEGTGCKKMTYKGKLENLIERAEELLNGMLMLPILISALGRIRLNGSWRDILARTAWN